MSFRRGACQRKARKTGACQRPAPQRAAVARLGALRAAAAALVLSGCAHAPSEPLETRAARALAVADPAPRSDLFTPQRSLRVCDGFSTRNLPKTDAARRITSYRPFVEARGVRVATAPTRGVCVTSGFGPRGGRLHKGVDYAPDPKVATAGAGVDALPAIHAAADGVVREVRAYRGYGRTVVIDHGGGVHTRYAHLSRFAEGLREGDRVRFGQPIGRMGRSGRRGMGVHLHYELLIGAYRPDRLAFALDGRDPLAAAPATPPVGAVAGAAIAKTDRAASHRPADPPSSRNPLAPPGWGAVRPPLEARRGHAARSDPTRGRAALWRSGSRRDGSRSNGA